MEDTCNVDHITGTDVDHVAGTDVDHVAGTDVDNVAGTDVDHVTGTDVDHVAGTDVDHVAGTDVDHVAGTDVDHVAGTDVDQSADGANEAGMPGSIENTTSACRPRSSAILIPALSTMDTSPLTTAAAPYKTYSTNFQVDSSMIQSVDTSQQAAELQNLGLSVFNQDQFEMGVMAQVDEAFAKEEKERLQKRLQKEMKAVNDDIRKVDEELKRINSLVRKYTGDGVISDNMVSMHRQRENKLKQMKSLRAKERSLLKKLSGSNDLLNTDEALQCASDRTMNEVLGLNLGTTAINETESERLVRVGEMTPFGTIVKPPTEPKASTSKLTEFELFLTGQDAKMKQKAKPKSLKRKVVGRSSLNSDSFSMEPPSKGESNFFDVTKPRRVRSEGDARQRSPCRPKRAKLPHNFASDHELSDSGRVGSSDDDGDGDEYLPTKDEWRDSSDDCRPFGDLPPDERGPKIRKHKRKKSPSDSSRVKSPGRRCNKDDGSYTAYQRRLSRHRKDHLKRKHERILNSEEEIEDESDVEIDDDFKCPSEIWNKLYRYQKTGVRWLWELHSQQTGGIVGDEMGLGKTIQIIAFLTALKKSQLRHPGFKYQGLGPVIIICPTTVMHQWVKEFHTWWPPFRVSVLHSTGSFHGSEANLIYSTYHNGGVLVMSYGSLLIHQEALLKYNWHYVILDEGHKIRNPDAQVTIACKQFRTPHRLILSGSPMQNNLKELWSLFDFVYPGKLGTLPDFMEHFSVPITQGGYSNASDVQVQTAYKCACVLRDTISPYLLRRMKADVASNIQLPEKNEQVLFCRLTDRQRDIYKEYLNSKECQSILSGNYMVFPGLITLRKICNHPDLTAGSERQLNVLYPDMDVSQAVYGYPDRSGKMIVVKSLLRLWKKQGHRVLLFTQGKQMLDILETFVLHEKYSYMRMDGTTSIGSRQGLINKFNQDEGIFVFILTTKVGGLGVNLVGADRVIIFDPDWNPSTDTQARERAWRIGQTRQVTIYRLLTSGTIEEKIYHRQIFKQFLTNRVLKDPKQRRFFKSNDLHELFTLTDEQSNGRHGTETSALFAGTGSDVRVKVSDDSVNNKRPERRSSIPNSKSLMNRFDIIHETKTGSAATSSSDDDGTIEAADDSERRTRDRTRRDEKCAKMRELARQLSLKIGQNYTLDTTAERCTNISEPCGDRRSGHLDSPPMPGEESHYTTSNGVKKLHKREKKPKSCKKSHRRKHRRKDAEVEGAQISHLVKRGDWTTGAAEQTNSDNHQKQDDFVLKSLFKKSGVHSAVQHDRIMDATDPDYLLVEKEAERVAREAARALKQSRTKCRRAEIGVPTWTGQSGLAGAPGRPRFGQKKNVSITASSALGADFQDKNGGEIVPAPKLFDGGIPGLANSSVSASNPDLTSAPATSATILEKILKRSETRLDDGAGRPDVEHTGTNDGGLANVDLLNDIRSFVAFQARHDGRASTQELLDAFTTKLPPSESAKFKAMLREICTFERHDDVGIWVLKEEFR